MDETRSDAMHAFRTIVEATHIENEHDYTNEQWSLGRKCITRLAKASKWISKLFPSLEELRQFFDLWNDCTLLHQVHGLYPEASLFYERALDSLVATLGNGHLRTARTKLGLAKLYRLLDRNDDAKSLYDECFRVFVLELGSNALKTTQAVVGLGIVKWR